MSFTVFLAKLLLPQTYRFLIVNVAVGKLTNSWAKSWGGGPTVKLIITSSLSFQYKEKQPFTVFQTALQNTLILSYLYQCDRIIPEQRINRKQNPFSFPVTHYLFCVCVRGAWSRSLRKFLYWVEFFFFFFFFGGGTCFCEK